MSVAALAQDCWPTTHTPAARDSLWQSVLGALIATGGVSCSGEGTGSSEGSKGGAPPPGEGAGGDAEHWTREYMQWNGHWDEHHEKCSVVRQAGWHLAALAAPQTHDPRGNVYKVAEETAAEFAARLIADGEGWSLKDVAVHFRCLERVAAKIRREAGRHQDTGMPITVVATVKSGRPHKAEREQTAALIAARAHRARQLRNGGLSIRAIAPLLGVDAATIHRDLGRATDLKRAS